MTPGLHIFRNPGVSIHNEMAYPIILRGIADAIERGLRSGKILLKTSFDTIEFGSWRMLDDKDDFDAIAEQRDEQGPPDAGAPSSRCSDADKS